jgi:predicted acyltransferase
MKRSIALDALRGLTIAAMILVNTPGSWQYIYAPLSHAPWHGWTPTDLIFPFFLFIVGSALYFSTGKAQVSTSLLLKIGRRTLSIVAIGMLLHLFSSGSFDSLRYMGVLQRIGLAYGMASLLVLFVPKNAINLIIILIALGYWALLLAFGGQDPYSLQDNLVRSIDIALLGEAHMYHINGTAFDPEGLLSTLPALINVLLGYQATKLLRQYQDLSLGALALLKLGLALILIGGLWSWWMPHNKSLWTSSYAVFSSGFAIVTLALFIWLIDVKGKLWLAKPFTIYGLNPLFIYALSWIWAVSYYKIDLGGEVNLYQWLYSQLNSLIQDPYLASFSFAALHVAFFWLIAYELYRRKIFISI